VLGELTAVPRREELARALVRWRHRLEVTLALAAIAGVGVLLAIVLSKRFFLGSDSANDYAHVWWIADQLFHHGRLPLHVAGLESGEALTFPYAVVPWLATAPLYAAFGDWSVTLMMVAGFVLYAAMAVWARPALREPRLLALVLGNTFLLEGLMSFQMAFIWACAFFFAFVALVDRRRWAPAALLAVATLTTHPFLGAAAVGAYALYTAARWPRTIVPLALALAAAAVVVTPFALYIRTAPSVETTSRQELFATLRWIARFRGAIVLLPLVVSACSPAFRRWFLVVFTVMVATFAVRMSEAKVNTFGITQQLAGERHNGPFYGNFIASPVFDRALRYRVLEPNDREDGAVQLLKAGAVLTQEFFDQSQFRRWWTSPDQYACFLGARRVDVVLLEGDYPLKFNQNEDRLLREASERGTAREIWVEPDPRVPEKPKFRAYDVRPLRRDGVSLADCGL